MTLKLLLVCAYSESGSKDVTGSIAQRDADHIFPSATIYDVSGKFGLRGRNAMERSTILVMVFSAWGVTTAVLVVLLIYRATLSSREDDQIFIDVAEQHHVEEQTEVIARMTRLRKPIIVLTASSAVLFLSGVSFWLYEGFKNF